MYVRISAINIYGSSIESLEGNGAIITTTPDAPTDLIEATEQRTKSTLGLSWTAPAFTGGAVIDEYRVSYAEQGGAFSVLESSVVGTSYLATGLTAGSIYEFKLEAKNSYSYSAFSETLSLLCAFVPDPPMTVVTVNTNEVVTVAWSEPVSNGSPVTAYKILVEEKDTGVFTQEAVDCDGTSSGVVTSKQCSIQLTTLKASPYNLVQGDNVNIRVVSVNLYGDSAQSFTGSGAVI